jgi:hypothetical protein
MDAILRAKRDARIDVLRGLALLMIFVDHIPGNKLGFVTLHVYGFADAAELFVLFAGFASTLAYGKAMLRQGFAAGARRVAGRCLRIYLTHVGLLLATLIAVRAWTKSFHLAPTGVAPLLDAGWVGVLHGLTLHALPGYLDILPLYIVLLALFPLLFVLMRVNVWLGLGLSAVVWLAAALDHRLNLPNWLDPQGWYFDPFSWQFLFAIGAALAVLMAKNGGRLSPSRWLTPLCWAYLAFAFLETFPFAAFGLPSLKPWTMAPMDKTHLAFWRILDVLAWMQLIFSTERTRAWAASRWARALEACGRHSLDIFALGCLLALFARLLGRTFGRDWPMQIAINVVGLSAMCLVALWLDRPVAAASIPAPRPRA